MATIVKGDLLKADEEYIVHQVNSKTVKGAGLSAALFKKFPYADVYKDGTLKKPGEIIIRKDIINLVGQDTPGKPKKNETTKKREKWFEEGLEKIEEISDLESIAFPYGIGSGLAGGSWENYQKMINKFTKRNPDVKVVIYKLDGSDSDSDSDSESEEDEKDKKKNKEKKDIKKNGKKEVDESDSDEESELEIKEEIEEKDKSTPTVVCVKVSNIRPKYQDLKQWMKDKNNVYIGRKGVVFVGTGDEKTRWPEKDSIWANKHTIKDLQKEGLDENKAREEAIKRYKKYLMKDKNLISKLSELGGKTLGCWCHPDPCHGDVLIELYNKIVLKESEESESENPQKKPEKVKKSSVVRKKSTSSESESESESMEIREEFSNKIIMSYSIKDGYVYVIDDGDKYQFGTKQRVIKEYLIEKTKEGYNEFIYAGPANAMGAYALAYGCYELGFKCTLFLVGKEIPNQGLKFKANIQLRRNSLQKVEDEAKEYTESNDNKCLVPFGINDPLYIDLLKSSIEQDHEIMKLRDIPNARLWLAVGSGTILKVLMDLLPNVEFHAVQVGKTLRFKDDRIKTYWSPEKFMEPASFPPPYSSLINYDAKIWQFVYQDGKDGDYIFNIAKDF